VLWLLRNLKLQRPRLATAIRLYFEDRDPISVHTLVMASNEIINRICEAKGIAPMRSDLLNNIVEAKRDEIGRLINEARNFFKHAREGDPDETLSTFSVSDIDDINLSVINFSVIDLHALGEIIGEVRLFDAWISVVHPELIDLSPPKDYAKDFGDIADKPLAIQKKAALKVLRRVDSGIPPPARY
jgi:hypothetical protein